MGWLVRYDHDSLPCLPDACLRGRCEYPRDGASCTILASAFAGQVGYAAAKIVDPGQDSGAPVEFVTAYVYLTRGSARSGFGYKSQCESMGPNEYDCPDRIMALLSPIEQIPHAGYAADWRRGVTERKAEKRRVAAACCAIQVPGTRIRFPEPLAFTSGTRWQEFEILPRRKRQHGATAAPIVDGKKTGFTVRLPSRLLAIATVIGTEEAQPAAAKDLFAAAGD